MGLMQTLLTILVARSDGISPADASRLVKRSRQATQKALASLAKREIAVANNGIYRITDKGMQFHAGGEIIKSGPCKARGTPRLVANTLRAKVWRAIRIKRKFGLDDLARTVLDGSEAAIDPVNNINRYVTALARAGYLQEMKRRSAGSALTSPGSKRWLLVRDTGLKPPVRRQAGGVYDQNECRMYGLGDDHVA